MLAKGWMFDRDGVLRGCAAFYETAGCSLQFYSANFRGVLCFNDDNDDD